MFSKDHTVKHFWKTWNIFLMRSIDFFCMPSKTPNIAAKKTQCKVTRCWPWQEKYFSLKEWIRLQALIWIAYLLLHLHINVDISRLSLFHFSIPSSILLKDVQIYYIFRCSLSFVNTQHTYNYLFHFIHASLSVLLRVKSQSSIYHHHYQIGPYYWSQYFYYDLKHSYKRQISFGLVKVLDLIVRLPVIVS